MNPSRIASEQEEQKQELKSLEQTYKRGIHVLKLLWWIRESEDWINWFEFSYDDRIKILKDVLDGEPMDFELWRLIVYMSKYPQSYPTNAVEHILSIL